MKKYAVFKKQNFVPIAELSISKKIIEKETPQGILDIVRKWIKQLWPTSTCYIFYNNYQSTNKNQISDLMIQNATWDHVKYCFVIIEKESNFRIRIGYYNTVYEIGQVNEE